MLYEWEIVLAAGFVAGWVTSSAITHWKRNREAQHRRQQDRWRNG